MGDIITASGSRMYIGGNAVTSAEMDTLAEFEAVTTWTEIGLIESMGEFGDAANEVTFAALGDARIRKSKGARDAGTMEVVVGHDPLDTGQLAVETAEQTNSNYPFKVVIPDGPTDAYQDSIFYFRALVMSRRLNVGTNDNVVRKTYNIGINSEVFADPAST